MSYENYIEFHNSKISIETKLRKNGTYDVQSIRGSNNELVTRTELTEKQLEQYVKRLGAKEAIRAYRNKGQV